MHNRVVAVSSIHDCNTIHAEQDYTVTLVLNMYGYGGM